MAVKRNTELTTSERDALNMYNRLTEKAGGTPPTSQELATALGYTSRQGGHLMITRLREKGFLTMRPVTVQRLKLSTKGKRAL
jgi:SOS-response transcriptional repressor LexA